ncbi:MAG: hypothetical protein EXR62_07720 [Chloroflexi bacterium]|nr:hypothetical protein [Chloroflexota bacterium]
MIELYLSSDGKHTVHVSADTPAELAKLTPTAKALYQKVIAEFGTKQNKRQAAGKPAGNGHAQVEEANAPQCPVHQTAMVYRQGRFGPFWSCWIKAENGAWCQETKDIPAATHGQIFVA